MILNLNVKESPQRIDLFINFDVPFSGKIVQKREKGKIILFLQDVKILAPWEKKLSSSIAYQVAIKPAAKGTSIIIYTTASPKLYAAKSKDGFSLKISLLKSLAKSAQTSRSIDWITWLKWIGIALGTIIVLLILAKLLSKLSGPRKSKRIIVPHDESDFRIVFEKPLDEKNKIALISFKGIDYLVLIGSTNVLLGKYEEGALQSYEDFEKAIDNQDLAKAVEPKPQEEIFTTIEEYKRKASGNL